MYVRLKKWLIPSPNLAIVQACLIGSISGLVAVLLKQGIGVIGGWRLYIINQYTPLWTLPLISGGLAYISGYLIQTFQPAAAGSGVPQVKAVLAQLPLPLTWQLALIKLITATLALGGGLTLGRQGPTVQIGASVAATISKWLPTTPTHRRQLIAAGGGAGLAAGFNTPIAGILFVAEELLQDLSGNTLGTTILACFIGAVISRLLGVYTWDLNLENQGFQSSLYPQEIPFYLLLGLLCGGFSSLFIRTILHTNAIYKRIKLTLAIKMGIAGIICGVVMSFLPANFHDNTGLRELFIKTDANWRFALIAFLTHFILTPIASGSGAPGGLFNPALILGSALGYLVGSTQYYFLGIGTPNTYVLAGMGAFFAGVTKSPITAIVIIFEMTRDFNLVLPLMIATVIAYLVAEGLLKGSIYHHLLAASGYELPTTINSNFLTNLTAADCMEKNVKTLNSNLSLSEVIQKFSSSHHRGFPVVNNGQLLGMLTQTDLVKIQSQLSAEISIVEIMTPNPITTYPQALISDVLYLFNRYGISRLPVIENNQLVGIITRSDLIKLEADYLSGEKLITTKKINSYVIYQTRSPSMGQPKLLVPIANPQTAKYLLHIALSIAEFQGYEIECLQVIPLGVGKSPSNTRMNDHYHRELLEPIEKIAQKTKVSIHTQIRLANDITQGILDTISEEKIKLVIMGWDGKISASGSILGQVVDRLIATITIDLMLVKFNDYQSPLWESWLLPIAGGPNSKGAIKILPGLLNLAHEPRVNLCQVISPNQSINNDILAEYVRILRNKITTKVSIVGQLISHANVVEGILQLASAKKTDVIILGASQESLLGQFFTGNISQQIVRDFHGTVILFKQAKISE